MDALKTERILREFVLFFIAIILFPFMTFRVLIWKWHFWLRNNEKLIKKDHDEYQGLK